MPLHLDADHAFDPTQSASLTPDSHWFCRHSDANLRVKYLDVQRKFGGAIVVRIGVHGMPMLSLNNQWHGSRSIDSIRTSLQKVDSGAGGNVSVKGCRVPTADLAMPVVSGGDYEEPAHAIEPIWRPCWPGMSANMLGWRWVATTANLQPTMSIAHDRCITRLAAST